MAATRRLHQLPRLPEDEFDFAGEMKTVNLQCHMGLELADLVSKAILTKLRRDVKNGIIIDPKLLVISTQNDARSIGRESTITIGGEGGQSCNWFCRTHGGAREHEIRPSLNQLKVAEFVVVAIV